MVSLSVGRCFCSSDLCATCASLLLSVASAGLCMAISVCCLLIKELLCVAHPKAAARRRTLNEAFSYGLLSGEAGVCCALRAPEPTRALRWDGASAFQGSALCAAALDAATLPFRLVQPSPRGRLGAASGATDM
jgi:hypothetical protein